MMGMVPSKNEVHASEKENVVAPGVMEAKPIR
jgi:hypothetical protein